MGEGKAENDATHKGKYQAYKEILATFDMLLAKPTAVPSPLAQDDLNDKPESWQF